MNTTQTISRVVNLLDESNNILYGMSADSASASVATGDTEEIRKIEGHFALVAVDGTTVHMVRTIGRLMRYFIAKRAAGPTLVVSDRIDAIRDWLVGEGLADQFHPSYTRMVPAHHLVTIRLVGCPDPNPTYQRFFDPPRGMLRPNREELGTRYVQALHDEIVRWLETVPADEPIGVCFSGGIDSGSVFLLTYHSMRKLGMNLSRLKAFTLSVDGGGADLIQAREFLRSLDLELFLEVVEVSADEIDLAQTIRIMEDYKPLDVQSGAMAMALFRGIRARYPQWKYLMDGDGGDENLKDYPIEENPELTIRSVLNNSMLYQEGWGVDSIKHSLTYSGGQSRGYARTYAPARAYGFSTLSPYVATSVIEIAEGIPFIEMTDWDHQRLYDLKGEIVSIGVRSVTGLDMPVFPKRRFQHGTANPEVLSKRFPSDPQVYRRLFHAIYE